MRLHNIYNSDELKKKMLESDEKRKTISFYKYFNISNPQQYRDWLYLECSKLKVFGRIYVAQEGINAQISVPEDLVDAFRTFLYTSTKELDGLRLNIAVEDNGKSFYKLKIKVRHKIVADGLDDLTFDPSDCGLHLSAAAFNDLTSKPGTILVDMRNHYETEVGRFEGALLPDVETFREELDYVENLLKGNEGKDLVMYCTGGIRCEKASAYFKHKGFKNVFQLNGGIIKYANDVKAEGLPNKFRGKNFVFDERMGERISDDIIAKCHQCGEPCDTHINCANTACHILFIQCPKCAEKYNTCCSEKCADFTKLPIEEQIAQRKTEVFNGTKFGKGRYKAHKKDDGWV